MEGSDHYERELLRTRENEVREHIPVPYDNLFQAILSFASRFKAIFSVGTMITQAMTTVIKLCPSKEEIENYAG